MLLSDSKLVSEVLSNIINFSDDAIVSKTTEGIITTWNPAAEKIFGYSAAEAVGKPITIIIPEHRLHEETTILRKVTGNEYIDHYETERVAKNGRVVYVSLIISPIKDPEGRITGILKIARDISIRKRAEEVEARMADIIKFSDDAIITKTLDGTITSWNRGAEQIFGYAPREILGKHISILIPPGRIDEEPRIIEKIKAGEYIDHYETVRQRKDATLVNISLSVSAIRDPSGKILGISKIARDITARKKAEELQSWFVSIVNFSDDAIISKTLDGIISTWNYGAQKIFGYTPEEVIGKHVSILIPEGRLDEEPEIIERVTRGEYIDHYETERVRKDGHVIPISLTVSPIRDGQNNIVGISKIARDISLRKRSEEATARLAAIVNYSDDAIISKTLEGVITSWNAGAVKIFGYSAGEAIGSHISLLIPPARISEEDHILGRIRSGLSVEHYETVRLRKDGTPVHISLTVSPIRDPGGLVIGASKIARDITEKKKWEDDLLQLNSQLEAFNYSVSHDLKLPLRTMNNYLGMLSGNYKETIGPDALSLIDTIRKSADRMNTLIDSLLTFSQLQKQDVVKIPFSMEDLVSEILGELITTANGPPIHATLGKIRPVPADKNLLRHVWENLISNAIKYSSKKERPSLRIDSTEGETSIIYFISDNGAGFDMKYSEKLFTAFQRLHSQRDFEGTGVGLAIVSQIVWKHGGTVWAESKLNEGSTFYFALPK